MKNIDYKNIEALLLDLDGTLINSEKAFCNSFKKILLEIYKIKITNEDYKKYELEQNAKLLETLRNKGLLTELDDKIIMKYIYNDYENEFKKIIVEQEAIDNFRLLKKLKKLKLKLALVTTCKRYYLDILLDKLDIHDLFDVIIAREDAKNLKPSTEAYLKSIDYLGVNPERCLAFEDSKRGIDSAINSGLKTIQVSNFTDLKYNDDRTINYNSANEILNEILNYRKKLK